MHGQSDQCFAGNTTKACVPDTSMCAGSEVNNFVYRVKLAGETTEDRTVF